MRSTLIGYADRHPERVKFLIDLSIWIFASFLAFILRLSDPWEVFFTTVLPYLFLGGVIGGAAIWLGQLPRQAWRQSTVHDLQRIAATIAVATVVLFLLGLIWYELVGFPRTVPLIAGALALIGMGGIRMLFRVQQEAAGQAVASANGSTSRVLLVGAGSAGSWMARELRRHPHTGMIPIGFLDDDRAKRRQLIGGLAVLGSIDDLPSVVHAHRIDQILITMPSAPGASTRRVVDLAQVAGVGCRILPGVSQILAGQVTLEGIREVQVEDLLRREAFELDLAGPADYLSGRVVLVTGAGGSIGSELVRQVARCEPERIVLFGRGENSLHAIEQQLARDLPGLDRVTVVGSVTDRTKLEDVFALYEPRVVFHAAAHKHVPLMEHHPDEAVINNVGGTLSLAEVAAAAGVRRLVNISSDKAVHPASMVGVTKAIGERVVRAVAAGVGPDRSFMSVRFGNVLGSRGSVVPIFQEQIRRGGPITLTHPDMTRYFMTIPEAARLVIQAAAIGRNGAVFVLDMGTPVRIEDLARDMIRLSGANEREIAITYAGLRPGEKLAEELFTDEEQTASTRYEQIMMAMPAVEPASDLLGEADRLVDAARRRDWGAIGSHLKALEPGFELGTRGASRYAVL